MFTGIVTDVGEITSLKPVAQGQLHRMRIACRYDQTTIADGVPALDAMPLAAITQSPAFHVRASETLDKDTLTIYERA